MVIGLAGQRLSGKNTAANYLHKKHGFFVLDFTKHVLTPVLRRDRKKVTRENLTTLAMSMRKKHGKDILARRLCERIESGRYVIAGIRFPEEVKYLKERFGRDFILIGVICNPRIRYGRISRKRTKEDKDMSYQDFLRKEKLPTENIIPGTMKLSDFSLTNEKSKKELYENIDRLMERIKFNK